MLPHQQRVVDEKAELDAKAAKLFAFIQTATFDALPGVERLLLMQQDMYMTLYSRVLEERIKLFVSTPAAPVEVFVEHAKCTACDGTGVSTGNMAPVGDVCPRCKGTRKQLDLMGMIMPHGLTGEPMHYGKTEARPELEPEQDGRFPK